MASVNHGPARNKKTTTALLISVDCVKAFDYVHYAGGGLQTLNKGSRQKKARHRPS